jgi:hypothetical protein
MKGGNGLDIYCQQKDTVMQGRQREGKEVWVGTKDGRRDHINQYLLSITPYTGEVWPCRYPPGKPRARRNYHLIDLSTITVQYESSRIPLESQTMVCVSLEASQSVRTWRMASRHGRDKSDLSRRLAAPGT